MKKTKKAGLILYLPSNTPGPGQIFISSDGNVGIGISNPHSRLDVLRPRKKKKKHKNKRNSKPVTAKESKKHGRKDRKSR
jgi:hypothetical protein